MNSLGLVSIVVITYNSSNFIVETLDSISNQTYPKIELIISDDSSTDDTIPICEQWINDNKERFVKYKIIKSDVNTGVSANCNRGEKEASGTWVKPLAGDDILRPDAIEKYVQYMEAHPQVTYLFGKMLAFGDNSKDITSFNNDILVYDFFNDSAKEQYHRLMNNKCYIPAPTFFYNRKQYLEDGISNDESIPMLEDWPKWVNITKRGHRVYLLDSITVNYRIHNSAISKTTGLSKFSKSQMLFYIKYQFRYNILRHPRTSWIKYVMYKQCLSNNPIWNFFEKIGRFNSRIYCWIRHTNIDDWDKIEKSIYA